MDIGEDLPRPTMSDSWLKCICRNRDDCLGTASGKDWDEVGICYVFVYATQSPVEVWFAQAQVKHMTPAYSSLTDKQRLAVADDWYPWQLSLTPGKCVCDLDLVWNSDSPVELLQCLSFEEWCLMRSRGPLMSTKDWE